MIDQVVMLSLVITYPLSVRQAPFTSFGMELWATAAVAVVISLAAVGAPVEPKFHNATMKKWASTLYIILLPTWSPVRSLASLGCAPSMTALWFVSCICGRSGTFVGAATSTSVALLHYVDVHFVWCRPLSAALAGMIAADLAPWWVVVLCMSIEAMFPTFALKQLPVEEVLILRPTDFQGDASTAVAGRVVISRVITFESKGKSKGKGRKKTTDGGVTEKCELHVLGGPSMSQILYVEAFGDDARALEAAAPLQSLRMFRGLTIVQKSPTYSTSTLTYYARAQAIGRTVHVEELPATRDEDWDRIPMEHPMATLDSMREVQTSGQECAKVLVLTNPGVIRRQGEWGTAGVCNATVKLEDTTIRCSFWRTLGDEMAKFEAGRVIVMYQVNVVKTDDDSWELRGTPGTKLVALEGDAARAVSDSTSIDSESRTLTRNSFQQVDYETVKDSLIVTAGTVASVVMPGKARDLKGVYDLHYVNITGLTPIGSADNIWRTCCGACKKIIYEDACHDHPGAPTEERILAKVHFADHSGSGEALVYQEATEDSRDVWAQDNSFQIVRGLKSTPWSFRLVYKTQEYGEVHENFLEIKKMKPTVTADGILSHALKSNAATMARNDNALPLCACKDLFFVDSLGLLKCNGIDIQAARIVVRALEIVDPESALSAAPGGATKVARQCTCCVAVDDVKQYAFEQRGTLDNVRWMIFPQTVAFYMLVVTKISADGPFVVLSHHNINSWNEPLRTQYTKHAVAWQNQEATAFEITATPSKRLKTMIDEKSAPPGSTEAFGHRSGL